MAGTKKTVIIAEAGDNHNGDIRLAFKLIDAAVDARADYVKFQAFKAEAVVAKFAAAARYQNENREVEITQYELLQKLELPLEKFGTLKKYAERKGIVFISSAFDLESQEYLASIDVEMFKIPSGEVTNLPYLMKVASCGKPVIMSTGMSAMVEIEDALAILRSGGCGDISLLHCNTQYPTPYEDVNLKAMQTLKDVFNLRVGYSDHTLGLEVPLAAVALGAEIIEKHFTLDRSMQGPDHKASLEPGELKAMVTAIRKVEKALGDGVKKITPAEEANKDLARKSIVAAGNIKKGEVFAEDTLAVKRPGTGISPMRWYEVLGRTAPRDFTADEMIEL